MTSLVYILQAVNDAARATAHMEARAGRASYVSAEHHTLPDAGATAVAMWMTAAIDTIISCL